VVVGKASDGAPNERHVARTLDDLAALTGVSRATVSRVINGGSAAESTRRHVQEVLARTSYRPNAAARKLASGRSGVVGVVVHVDPHLLFPDPYFSQLLQGITDHLAEQGAGMMLWLGNRTKEQTLDHVLGMSFLDGVIISAHTLEDPVVDGLLSSGLPTVLIGHRRADRTASYVDIDNEQAADAITTHLISIGRTRVGHVTGSRGTVSGEDRVAGYQRAMRRAGLRFDRFIIDGDFTRQSGVSAAAELLELGVDAMFCANDASAAGALETIRASGLRIPEDVALAGFDDVDFAAHLDPPLTTVRQALRQHGMEAARALLQLLGDPGRAPRRVLMPTELVIRQSSVGGVPHD
jgi:LacI family transcriptional regulator